MSGEWTETTLGELCLKITDGSHSSPPSAPVGKPMASVKDLTRFGIDLKDARQISEFDYELLVKQGCQPEVGDVLIAKDGSSALDTTCLVKEPLAAVLLSSVAILRPNPEKLFPEYLKQYLSSPKTISYLKSEFISGAAIPRVIIKDFKRAIVKVPPIEEQRRIAHILGTLDDKIENNRKTAKTLEAMAQAIFKSWFVDFDPVRAKASGESTESICKRLKMTPEILALFPDGFEDSELGKIPRGWKVGRAGDHLKIRGGSTPSTTQPDYWDGGTINWATPKDLSGLQGPFLFKTSHQITDLGLSKISSGLLPTGTLLLSSRAPIGYIAISTTPIAINQGFIAITPDSSVSISYMWHWLRTNMDSVLEKANGSTFLEINKANFRDILMIVPPSDTLASYTDMSSAKENRIAYLYHESNMLSQVRDTLLPKLISGELRVDEAEELVEEATG
ncbi:restriction endonuclease subunit S [Acidithiobacillus sp. MC6.1]|nr:restriction endonuclease subunit S [Acidithiobacillus sp. MC6.1]